MKGNNLRNHSSQKIKEIPKGNINQDDQKGIYNKSYEEHTITEMLLMKEDIEELYGRGTFKQYVGYDILRIRGFSKLQTHDLEDASRKMNVEVVEPAHQKKKSFVEAVVNG